MEYDRYFGYRENYSRVELPLLHSMWLASRVRSSQCWLVSLNKIKQPKNGSGFSFPQTLVGHGTRNEPYERLRGRLERLQQLETCKGSCNCGIFCCPMYSIIVSTGDWLEKPANIKVQNNYAVVYVGSSLAVHNHLFFVYKLWLNKLTPNFSWAEPNTLN